MYRLIVLLFTIMVALLGPILVEIVVRQLADTILETASSDVSRLLEQLLGELGIPIMALLVLGICRHLVR